MVRTRPRPLPADRTARALLDRYGPAPTTERVDMAAGTMRVSGEVAASTRNRLITADEVAPPLPERPSAYLDDSYPERTCDHCGRLYRGPAVVCSLSCAIADA